MTHETRLPLWSIMALSLICALIVIEPAVRAKVYQQEADASFDAKVANPAYTATHPKVLIDAALDVDPKTKKEVSALGRSQGLSMRVGKGRVVILGEAAMMTAQTAGTAKLKFGMNRAGNDNKQLALNIMHWLSGLLDR